MSERPVGHHHAVVELVQRSPPLRRLVVVAQFDQSAAFFVKEQRVVGGHPTGHHPGADPAAPSGTRVAIPRVRRASAVAVGRPSPAAAAAAAPLVPGRAVASCVPSSSSSCPSSSALVPSALVLGAVKRYYCVVEDVEELVFR